MRVEDDIAERFPRDVADHKLEIIRNDGLYRHLRFRKPGTYCMGFDLITWPGHLCFTGDMGTFVFARIADMFEFFRADNGKINPSYWSEKVLAADREGVRKFDPDIFCENITRRLDEASASPELRRAAREEVLSACYDGEHVARQAASDFEHGGFRFEDFWESDCTDYTYRFIWCCHALVWAIGQFDAQAAPVKAAA